jgi:hypothetical protein
LNSAGYGGWDLGIVQSHRAHDPCARKDARLRTASVGRVGFRVMVGLAEAAVGLTLLAVLTVLAALVGLGWLAVQPRRLLEARRHRLRHLPA